MPQPIRCHEDKESLIDINLFLFTGLSIPHFVSQRCQCLFLLPSLKSGVSHSCFFFLLMIFARLCHYCAIHFYADGTTVHFNGKSVSHITTELQKDFDRLVQGKQTGL